MLKRRGGRSRGDFSHPFFYAVNHLLVHNSFGYVDIF